MDTTQPKLKIISAAKTAVRKYTMETRYLGEYINLRELQARRKNYKYLTRIHPLVIELGTDKYAVITRFGTVTFWNFEAEEIQSLLNEITPFAKSTEKNYPYTDNLVVFVGAKEERITFEELYLKSLDPEKIKIISYVSAQSVALDRYEEEIGERLKHLGKVVTNLKDGGTRFSQAEILRQVGNVLSVKQHAVSSLSLFDKPHEAWENPAIEELYIKLRNEYELRDRFDVLNEKINFLSENNVTLLNFINSEKANKMELIVIGLIVFEVLLLILQILKVI